MSVHNVFMGIDASLNRTGIAFINAASAGINSCTIIPEKGSKGMARLDELSASFDDLLDRVPRLSGVAIEGYAFGVRGGRLADLAEWGGLIRMALYKRRIPTIVVPPMTMKKFLYSGKLEKNQVLLQVYKQYGQSFNTDDEADAFVLSEMARNFYGNWDNLSLNKKEALQKCSVLVPKRATRERERSIKK